MKKILTKRDRQEMLLAVDLAISSQVEVIEKLARNQNSRMIDSAISERQSQIAKFEKLRASLRPPQAVTGIREDDTCERMARALAN